MRREWLVFVVVMSFLLTPVVCLAVIEVKPRISVRETYDDNIFLRESNEESDFFTTVIPGLALDWKTNAANLMLDYSLEYKKYKDNSSEDETNLKDIQRGLAIGEILPGRDFSIDLLQEFTSVAIDERRPSNDENTTVNSTTRSLSIINPHYRHQFTSTFMTYLDYRYDRVSYQSSFGDDLKSSSGRLELKKQLNPRLEMMVGGDYRTLDYRLSEDYDRYSGFAGLSFLASPRLSLSAVGGQTWLDFTERDDDETFVGDAMARLSISKEMAVGAGLTQDFGYATDDGGYRRKLARMIFGWNLSGGRFVGDSLYAWGNKYPAAGNALLAGRTIPKDSRPVSFESVIYTSKKEFYTTVREDQEYGAVLKGNLLLAEGWRLLAGGYLVESEYKPENEDVTEYGADAGLEYRRKIIVLSARYFFRDYDSDIDANDYVNNIFYLQLSVRFGG